MVLPYFPAGSPLLIRPLARSSFPFLLSNTLLQITAFVQCRAPPALLFVSVQGGGFLWTHVFPESRHDCAFVYFLACCGVLWQFNHTRTRTVTPTHIWQCGLVGGKTGGPCRRDAVPRTLGHSGCEALRQRRRGLRARAGRRLQGRANASAGCTMACQSPQKKDGPHT